MVVVLAALGRPLLEQLFDRPAFAHWATIFVAITVQAMPFLVLGIAIMARKGTAEGRKTAIPFGPFLAFGGMVGLIAGDPVVEWYLRTFA